MVAVSVVASADGALVDLAALRAASAETLVVLDATQALGWLPADLAWADAVVAHGYKWLLSPRGAAWMAVSDRLLPRLIPSGAGWYAGEQRWDAVYGLPVRLATDARRLDLSPAWFAHVGAAVALPWLASLDRAAVLDHDVGLANQVACRARPGAGGVRHRVGPSAAGGRASRRRRGAGGDQGRGRPRRLPPPQHGGGRRDGGRGVDLRAPARCGAERADGVDPPR